MGLYSRVFRSIDREIEVLERRIELRRSLIREREHELHGRVADAMTSPAAFAGAAALGFLLARGGRRPAGVRAAARAGLMARLGAAAMALLQMRYGSPYQWVARFVGGMLERNRRARPGGR